MKSRRIFEHGHSKTPICIATDARDNDSMPETGVKICGVTRPSDAQVAVRAGAWAIGMILWADARRRIDLDQARAIVRAVRGETETVRIVGVFVDAPADVVRSLAGELGLDAVQFHGSETPDAVRAVAPLPVVKAVRPDTLLYWCQNASPNLLGLLLDSPAGGSGQANDWDAVETALAQAKPTLPIYLAGGLNPDNVASVVARFRPAMVDVSSGVEDGVVGEKSERKVRDFVERATG
jgi:phosphoribosylanthranilate isomerase